MTIFFIFPPPPQGTKCRCNCPPEVTIPHVRVCVCVSTEGEWLRDGCVGQPTFRVQAVLPISSPIQSSLCSSTPRPGLQQEVGVTWTLINTDLAQQPLAESNKGLGTCQRSRGIIHD